MKGDVDQNREHDEENDSSDAHKARVCDMACVARLNARDRGKGGNQGAQKQPSEPTHYFDFTPSACASLSVTR